MNQIQTCRTVCKKKIKIYDVHFKYPDCYRTFWVAVLEDGTMHSQNGFLIDGKRLCFSCGKDFYDIDMLTNGLDWLNDLRKLAENTNKNLRG
jgi:hypothetical protein